ncbi:MAG: hypothetical protein M1822_004137 [Bathelium mastoideum]|nr:MAG: hypothetical protein M1822_004137 [Bathelium mastoideum]
MYLLPIVCIVAVVPTVLTQATFNPQNVVKGSTNYPSAVSLNISTLFNNRAFGMSPGDANFDGIGSGYPAQYLPPSNFIYNGVLFDFPQYTPTGNDNALAQGQTVQVPSGRYVGVHMMAAAEQAIATGSINAIYSDNTTTSGPVLVKPFWDWPYPYGGDIIFPYYLTNSSVDYNKSMIFQTINWLDSTKELTSIQLPDVSSGAANSPGGASEGTRLHLFSVSLVPAQSDGTSISLEVQYARSTQMWLEGTNKTQIVEVTINNVGTEWIRASSKVQITISAQGYTTVSPGIINRLRPGDQAIVQIGVVNTAGTAVGSFGNATVHVVGDGVSSIPYSFNAIYGIVDYDASFDSIYAHEAPMWYKNAKYGAFIHWGVYSVPGWGNRGNNESYAEWYWWDMNLGPDTSERTYEYNLATYGPDHVYDDFIQNFTASVFNPKEWVDLFNDAGMEYFVQVSKHHDGYAIFDLPANVSQRTSVAQFPHRNLLQELFDAAAQYQPQLHRGTYFSLPEWFNPAYAKYGFSSWPGGNATNPYTNQTLSYTGFVPVDDYISDVILPEMQTLANMGTEIMWCDIGGPNMTAEFASSWFNTAARAGRQVVMDNRCGLPGDFDSPEYAKYAAVQVRKWESNLGMDPFSYGYNRDTPNSAYLSPQGIVTSLVDIVSKNGNFLLDVGPTANGTIISVEQDNLRAAGAWIKGHAEAIFNTTYWYITPEEGSAVRFTQNQNAFYITTLYPPNATLTLNSPVPYLPGDNITVVGGNLSGSVVPAQLLGNGSLQMTISDAVRSADQYAWVFKIPYGGAESADLTTRTNANSTSTSNSDQSSRTALRSATGGGGGSPTVTSAANQPSRTALRSATGGQGGSESPTAASQPSGTTSSAESYITFRALKSATILALIVGLILY